MKHHREPAAKGACGMPIWIIAVVAFVCVVARPSWSAEWERIAEEEARIVFYPPGLSDGTFKKRDQTYANEEYAYWRGIGGMPRAEIYYSRLFPDRVYKREWKLEAVTRGWNFFKDKVLKNSKINRTSNVVSSIGYQQFTADDLHCISFLQSWGPHTGYDNDIGIPRYHIYGYYCDRSALSEATVKAVLSGIGVRGHKVPAKPSGHGVVKQEGDIRAADPSKKIGEEHRRLSRSQVRSLLLGNTEVGVLRRPSKPAVEGYSGQTYKAYYQDNNTVWYKLDAADDIKRWVWGIKETGVVCRGPKRRESWCRAITPDGAGGYKAVGFRTGNLRYQFRVEKGLFGLSEHLLK